jgi:malate dehydrogenase (oxaloacetate-decarboxylating)(NADP+)
MADELKDAAIEYHRSPSAGKLAIVASKPLANQRDLALAYSPGVAAACDAIAADPAAASQLTIRANLVAVITNGTAVLGLGHIGPLAAKPVMEGKAVLFKKFAGIDVFDIEINETDPRKLVDIIASLEPTFGAVNLEDIRAPECFEIEEALRKRMKIPVFHDDQHGTAIIVGAAVLNGLRVVGKRIEEVKLVSTGGGAAGLACLDLQVSMGLKPANVLLFDRLGVVHAERKEEMSSQKARYAAGRAGLALDEAIRDADIFLGLSVGGVLGEAMVKRMAPKPLILALANPVPEILPELARAARPDAVIATGRSDYPNQVNNVLCFPFIFRGALDVGATTINEAMKLACVRALAELARKEPSEVVAKAYGGEHAGFGPDYLIPRPFDPRLVIELPPAVAKAAMESGVATRPIADFEAYRQRLSQFAFRSGLVMKPVFERARQSPRRVVYAEGEEERVLRAVQVVVDEGLARPILVGRPAVMEARLRALGLRIRPGEQFEVVNPQDDPRYKDYWTTYHALMERKGVSPDYARTVLRSSTTVIAALMVRKGDAEAMICGTVGRYQNHLRHVTDVIGRREAGRNLAALSLLITPSGSYFICDTYVTDEPSAEAIVEMALMAAEEVRRFGVEPKLALLSHSNFGSHDGPSAAKMREALRLLHERAPHLEAEGEMHADAALSEEIRKRIFPNSKLAGRANLLIMPTLDAANIAFNMLKVLGDGLSVGPILLGAALPAHILTPSVTARGVVNMTAVAVVDAQDHGERWRRELGAPTREVRAAWVR